MRGIQMNTVHENMPSYNNQWEQDKKHRETI